MTVGSKASATRTIDRQITRTRSRTLIGHNEALGYTLMAPTLLLLAVFIAFPFALGVWYSLSDVKIFGIGDFVGLRNYQKLLESPTFRQTIVNTFIYTGTSTFFKLILGMGLALVMNQAFPFKNIMRASVLLPYIVPTALSTLAFVLIFHATLSPLPWLFRPLHIPVPTSGFLGDPMLAMAAVIFVNVWRGIPFFAITLLAGLQTIPQELYEAASIDGANGLQRFRNVTLPLLMPVLTVVLLFSIIQTFSDFQIVQVLTRGGPVDSTQLFATLAYQVALQGGELSQGAAISLFMMPFLALLVIAQLWYTRREVA